MNIGKIRAKARALLVLLDEMSALETPRKTTKKQTRKDIYDALGLDDAMVFMARVAKENINLVSSGIVTMEQMGSLSRRTGRTTSRVVDAIVADLDGKSVLFLTDDLDDAEQAAGMARKFLQKMNIITTASTATKVDNITFSTGSILGTFDVTICDKGV